MNENDIFENTNIKDRVINVLKAKGRKSEDYIRDIMGLSASSFRGSNRERDMNFNAVAKLVKDNPDINPNYLFGLSGDIFIDSAVQKGDHNTQNMIDIKELNGDYIQDFKGNKGGGVNLYFEPNAAQDIKIIKDTFSDTAKQGTPSETAQRIINNLENQIEELNAKIRFKNEELNSINIQLKAQNNTIDTQQLTIDNLKELLKHK